MGGKRTRPFAALLTQRNVEEAARAAGISTPTLIRWQKEPEFAAAYREARRAAFRQSIARLQQASSAAAATVLKIMLDQSTPASCRLRAAESVLSVAAKSSEIEDLEARISELERAMTAGFKAGRIEGQEGRIT